MECSRKERLLNIDHLEYNDLLAVSDYVLRLIEDHRQPSINIINTQDSLAGLNTAVGIAIM